MMSRAPAAFAVVALFGCGHVSSITEDASGDSDSDSDTDSDTGTDTDTDTDTDADACSASGTWYDWETGLCWQNPPSDDEVTWADAVSYCDGLSLGSHDDWRLPKIQELISLLRGCVNGTATGDLSTSDCGVTDPVCLGDECWDYPTCSSCGLLAGPDDDPNGCYWDPALAGTCFWYWSSSSHASDVSDAWAVGFAGGDVGNGAKSGTFYYRCVRGGP
jgi:hypothetical protein